MINTPIKKEGMTQEVIYDARKAIADEIAELIDGEKYATSVQCEGTRCTKE